MIDGGSGCSIAGDTIAMRGNDGALGDVSALQLYKYNQDLGGLVPIQDPVLTGQVLPMDLSHDYFVSGIKMNVMPSSTTRRR